MFFFSFKTSDGVPKKCKIWQRLGCRCSMVLRFFPQTRLGARLEHYGTLNPPRGLSPWLIVLFSFSYAITWGSCLSHKPFKKQVNKLPRGAVERYVKMKRLHKQGTKRKIVFD
jgi:hypothetical protein